jgi:hypothetical protein
VKDKVARLEEELEERTATMEMYQSKVEEMADEMDARVRVSQSQSMACCRAQAELVCCSIEDHPACIPEAASQHACCQEA